MDNFNTNTADGLTKQLSGLMSQLDSVMDSLPLEAKEAVPTAGIDILNLRNKLNERDMQGITDTLNKYSNISAFTMKKNKACQYF